MFMSILIILPLISYQNILSKEFRTKNEQPINGVTYPSTGCAGASMLYFLLLKKEKMMTYLN